jgi:hypothetical protein
MQAMNYVFVFNRRSGTVKVIYWPVNPPAGSANTLDTVVFRKNRNFLVISFGAITSICANSVWFRRLQPA